ncbi:hypothetical protein P691DRAFT_735531 [Macrolepiota fuliginosa MF-IS2]|uniref:GST N-terminal domain-containing protein n=1 Tax=Macrolepiota fuliginosa MF-IS2 TaxID=1400762 RepID=A0A9P5X8L6_9AGAR|nr:hypothetical protein P691DRAFT_735531 [Macrolepiota fuliginosa MF-IS2]
MITLYDITGKPPIKTGSPNVWKTRYVLNYKKLPHKTIFVEFPDIEDELKKAGIPPSGKKPDGVTPHYTCPSIIDDATGAVVSDSYKIAEYLDKAYPDTPKLFPPGTEALQAAFYDHFPQVLAPLWPIVLPRVPRVVMDERSAEHYIRMYSERFGMPLAQMEPVGEERVAAWAKVKAGFGQLDGWLSKSSGPFIMGDTVTFVDFVVASTLHSLRTLFGENSEEWRDIDGWNDGRWAGILKNLKEYASVEI